MNSRVLVVDDETEMCALLAEGLGRRGFEVTSCLAVAEAWTAFEGADFDVVVADLNLGGASGVDLCQRVVHSRPDVPVVVITAFGSLETAVAAIRAGAYDFITKPFKLDEVVLALRRATERRALQREVHRLREALAQHVVPEEIVGESVAMRGVLDLLHRIGDSDVSVLVTGESGTGKEVIARALHRGSSRRDGPFVAVSCAALPEPLLESELFGHTRGAFTDAREARPGLFRQACGGTLFLDEIGDMPPALQPKLLRVLQERSVRPVGGDCELPVDVRVVAATNLDLEERISRGEFRKDLYFRIAVITLELPPLRARGNDVLLLAYHLLRKSTERAGRAVTGISPEAARCMMAYRWPGNVRELQNCIERAVALTRFDTILLDDLPDRVRETPCTPAAVIAEDPEAIEPLEAVERGYIQRVLEALGGNKTLAARALGLDRKTLYRKLEKWGLGDER